MKKRTIVILAIVWILLILKFANGAGIPRCPEWDHSLLPEKCRNTRSFNCLPTCGKYPGDRPDIGAYEWFPGITAEKPWGDWNGIPLDYTPTFQKPKGMKIDGQ